MPGMEQWGLLLQQRWALACRVHRVGGGCNTQLWSPSSLDIGLQETPLDTLDNWVSVCSPLRAISMEPTTGSFCPHWEARSWVPGSGLGKFGQGVISGAKEEADSSTYPQLIPATQEPDKTDGRGRRRTKSQMAYVYSERQRLSLYIDSRQCCQERTLRRNQNREAIWRQRVEQRFKGHSATAPLGDESHIQPPNPSNIDDVSKHVLTDIAI